MDNSDPKPLSEAHQELVLFINPIDAPDIENSLKNVYSMAMFNRQGTLTEAQKDDLFYLEKIIRLVQNM